MPGSDAYLVKCKPEYNILGRGETSNLFGMRSKKKKWYALGTWLAWFVSDMPVWSSEFSIQCLKLSFFAPAK